MAACGAGDALSLDELAAEIAYVVARLAAGEPTCRRSPLVERDRARVATALNALTTASEEDWALERIARLAGVCRFHFLRLFARVTGTTPYRYLLDARLRRAATALAAGEKPISVIAFDEGFGDLSTFNARFKTTFGAAPSRWRQLHS
jgi:AraC family transcriptional regulator